VLTLTLERMEGYKYVFGNITLDFNAKVENENILHRQLGIRVYIRTVMVMMLQYKPCNIEISGC